LPRLRSVGLIAGQRWIDLADSVNLYLTGEQGRLYQEATSDSFYRVRVQQALGTGASKISELWSSFGTTRPLSIIDCGPASAALALDYLDGLGCVSPIASYLVIDINPLLLSTVAAAISRRTTIPVAVRQLQFEDVDRASLPVPLTTDVLFLIASTAMNYETDQFAALIRSMTRADDFVLIETLLSDGLTGDELLRPYRSSAVEAFVFEPLALLGARREDFEYTPHWDGERVAFAFRARAAATLNVDGGLRVRPADMCLTGFSRRPGFRTLQQELKLLFHRFEIRRTAEGLAVAIGQRGRGGR
jgi:hypothetical protein